MGSYFSNIFLRRATDGLFPGEYNIDDKAIGLDPKDTLISQLRASDEVFVEQPLSM